MPVAIPMQIPTRIRRFLGCPLNTQEKPLLQKASFHTNIMLLMVVLKGLHEEWVSALNRTQIIKKRIHYSHHSPRLPFSNNTIQPSIPQRAKENFLEGQHSS